MANPTSVYSNAYFDKLQEISANVTRENGATASATWFQFYMAVLSSGKWGGELPADCWPYMPEEFLINWGKVAAFKDDDGYFKIYPCYGCGELLENGFYKQYTIIAKNGKMWYRDIEDIEICLDNSSHMAPIFLIGEYAKKSGYAYAAVDTALQRAMLPIILEAPNASDITSIVDMIEKGETLKVMKVLQSSKFANGEIKVTQPFDSPKSDVISLWDITVRYRNLFYNLFGFNAIDIVKNERLTERESRGNDEIIIYTFAQDRYDCRIDFIDRVEKHFGIELEYEIKRNVNTMFEMLPELKDAQIENIAQEGEKENDTDNGTENTDTEK